jgi:multidrug transporter EmrE-like cation transporter
MGYVYLMLAILSTSFGQLLLKKYNIPSIKKIPSILVASILLLISVPVYIYLALQYISFAIVFISDAISIILVVVISRIFLKEYLNQKKIIGIVLILVGIFILNWKAI